MFNICKVYVCIYIGERFYICLEFYCGCGFISVINYKNYVCIYIGEKLYVCMVLGCGKCFIEYLSLYKYYVVYIYCKFYICSICGKIYWQIFILVMYKCSVYGELEVMEESEQVFYEQQQFEVVFVVEESLLFK